jgi:anti-sigma factor RsiW
MSHDPEQLAGRWLGAAMNNRQRRRYEAHLLECETCWQEITLARRGRALAEAARELAPADLRENIRAVIASAASHPWRPRARSRRPKMIAASSIVACALAASLIGTQPWRTSVGRHDRGLTDLSRLTAAVAAYKADRLPGTEIPPRSAPDLSTIGYRLVGAATGVVDYTTVTMFAYRNDTGAHLALYQSARPFAGTAEAHELGGPEGAWTTQTTNVYVLCGRGNHTLLVLGSDPSVVQHAGELLHMI